MCRALLKNKIDNYIKEYVAFMDIDQFPEYELQLKEVSQSIADSQGFEVPACTSYKVEAQKHTLCVSTNLELTKYVMFHEFTHMLDSEMYVNGSKMRYAGLSGYTEYHASQIELAKLVGARTVNVIPPFSMNMMISTIEGEKSIYQYVQEKYQHAISLFRRSDFPTNVNTLKSAFGVLYNYWGLRSICEMYSTDFTEIIDNEAFLKFVPSFNFSLVNNLMHGWLNKSKIDLSIPLYTNILFPIIQDYSLA